MGGSGDEAKGDTQNATIDINEPVSRKDFLQKVVAGGVISAVAITGLGGLQKVFGEKDSGQHESGDNSDISRLIHQVEKLSKQLDDLISGKTKIPEMTIIKLTVPDNGFLKIDGKSAFNGDAAFLKLDAGESTFLKLDASESTFHKLTVPEGGFLKINGDAAFLKLDAGESTFHKLSVPENGFLKIEGDSAFNGNSTFNGDSAFYKLSVPEKGFLKIEGESTFLKLDVPDTGFLKIDGKSAFNGDAAFLKLNATDIVAQKIVTGSITTGKLTTVG